MAHELAAAVGATFMSIDDGALGAEGNHRRVWHELAKQDTDWSVVLEDDAVPVSDFNDQLAMALAAAPTPVVSLYLGRQRPPQFQTLIKQATETADDDTCWLTSTHMLHAVGVAIRTELVPSLIGSVSNLPADQHIGVWARRVRHQIAYSWPSLVDHSDVPTLVNHPDGADREPGRTAWRVGSRPHWTSKSVPLSPPGGQHA